MTTKGILFVPDFGAAWTTVMLSAFRDQAARLGELDRQSGDGDFGTNLTTATGNAQAAIADSAPGQYADWLTAVSRGFLATGGTSGPLFGMFFRDMARCAQGATPTLGEFADGLCKGVATVRRYGKAVVGDKTMIDALDPAAGVLTSQAASGVGSAQALMVAAEAAVAGARSTVGLRARRGRASYVGDAALGVLDPGAVVAALALQAAFAAQSGTALVDTAWLDLRT
jgi:dihydroxyacetone kinase-like protein